MKYGCLKLQTGKRGPHVWQFRWSETNPNGERVHHKKVIGTIEHYPDQSFARRAVVGLVSESTRMRNHWGQAILRKYIFPAAQRVGIQLSSR
jgi:hypothetical protein